MMLLTDFLQLQTGYLPLGCLDDLDRAPTALMASWGLHAALFLRKYLHVVKPHVSSISHFILLAFYPGVFQDRRG